MLCLKVWLKIIKESYTIYGMILCFLVFSSAQKWYYYDIATYIAYQ